MAYKYYDQKLGYIMNDLLIYGFQFSSLRAPLAEIFEKRQYTLPDALEIELKFTGPTRESPLIQDFYNKGEIKSHELNEILKTINNKIINGLELKSTYLFNSLTRFYRFKSCIEIQCNKTLVSQRARESSNLYSITILIRNLERFTTKLILAVIKEFNLDTIGYCEEVEASLSTATMGTAKTVMFNEKLERIKLVEAYKFLTIKDKDKIIEFFSCPEVKDVLFRWFFPEGFDKGTITEITFDKLKPDSRAQKRRRIRHINGKYENIFDVFNQYTTIDEFIDIINRNDICSFYASIRTARKRYLATAIIDIDTSRFLRQLISPQILWEFTITLSKEIIKTCISFGLDKPLVIFSGKRGVHLLWRVTAGLVRDDYNYSNNFWEIFLLPAQKSLRKDPKSLVRSKFGLIKKVFEAILLYTAYNFDITLIPDEIKVGLGIARSHDLFKLSPFSDNAVGVLLDTSTLNGSVHRVFSFHFSSGLISIPITNHLTKEIDKKFEDYEVMVGESKPDLILDNIKQSNVAHYYQFPPIITKSQIKSLFHPCKGLLPIIALIVRFSDRWVTERGYYSYKFWIELYSITTFYNYLINWLLILEPEDYTNQEVQDELNNLIDNCRNYVKQPLKELVDDYFRKKLSFITLKNTLLAFKNFEFFYRVKYDELKPIKEYKVSQIFENKTEVHEFLNKFQKVYSIIQVWLIYGLKKREFINKNRERAVKNLLKRLRLAIQHSISRANYDMVYIISLYNIYIKFLKEFFQFDRILIKEQ